MDLVNELRKLEGVNTSFDYGVEIIVMVVKETTGDYDDLKTAIINRERSIQNIFKYDSVCKNGFNIAKQWLWDYIKFHNEYLEFIREFRYDADVYCMISDELITLDCHGKGQLWANRESEYLENRITEVGFKVEVHKPIGRPIVEFRVLGKL